MLAAFVLRNASRFAELVDVVVTIGATSRANPFTPALILCQ